MLEKFNEWLQLNKNSPKTISTYFQQVNCFGKFCDYQFTQDNLNKYLIKLKEENKSIRTINLFKNSFSNYCQFAKLDLEIPSSKYVRRQGIKFYLTEKDLSNIFKNITLISDNYKFAELVLLFMFYTGVRPSEIFNLHVKDINFESKDIHIYNAKGNKDRTIPFMNNILYEELKKHCQQKSSEETVFNITYNQILYLIKKIKNVMHIQEHIEPRTFRISFAKYCLSIGMDISYLKKLMGHADIKITELYAEPDEKMIKDFCEKIRKEK